MTTKVALITGGARRIGAEIVRTLHSKGYRVTVHYWESEQDAKDLVGALNIEVPGSARAIQGNLASEQELSNLVEQCVKQLGGLSLLVNNASAFYPTPIEAVTAEVIDQLSAINVKAPLLLSKFAASHPDLESIVNLIDIHAKFPLKNYSVYSMTKAALEMMTQSLALELAPQVSVNGVSPGAVLWPEADAAMDSEEQQHLLAQIPMGSLGPTTAVAEAVCFLAEANHVTGQILAVDGGQLAASLSTAR